MKITADKHFVNERSIAKGWASLDVHSIRIGRYFTEEEQAKNSAEAAALKAQYGEPGYYQKWSERCESIRKEISDKVYKLLCELEKRYTLYQFRGEDDKLYRSNEWDLFFWCNWKNGERDYSYITLTLRKSMTREERMQLTEKLEQFFVAYNETGIQAIIQYDEELNKDVVQAEAEKLFGRIKDTFVTVGCMTGKFKKLPGIDGYAFFKKRAKNHYYRYDAIDLLTALKEENV